MEFFLKNIINHIGDNMPQLQTIDEDYGQLEEGNDTYPLVFPAVLINAPETQWDNIGALAQKGITSVSVRLLIDCYDDNHYGAHDASYRAAERENLCRVLHKTLQGFEPELCASPLIRTASRLYTAGHGIKVYECTYICEVSEEIGTDRTTVRGLKAGPEVEIVER